MMADEQINGSVGAPFGSIQDAVDHAPEPPKRSRKKPAPSGPRFVLSVRGRLGEEWPVIWRLPVPGGPPVTTMQEAIAAVEATLSPKLRAGLILSEGDARTDWQWGQP